MRPVLLLLVEVVMLLLGVGALKRDGIPDGLLPDGLLLMFRCPGTRRGWGRCCVRRAPHAGVTL